MKAESGIVDPPKPRVPKTSDCLYWKSFEPIPSGPNLRGILVSRAAFNARDIDAVLAAMHLDVIWPNGWEGGHVYGHQGVRDYWTRQWGEIDPHVEPVGFATDEQGRIILTVHQVGRDLEGNVITEGMVEHVYLIEDGLIKSMEIKKP